MHAVLLAVKQTGSVVQTADGGIEFITKADLGGGGGGGGDATAANQVIGNASLATIEAAVVDLASKSRQAIKKVTGQVIDIAATTGQSAAVNASTTRVVLTSTVNCWYELGSNPTALLASGTSCFLAAGCPSYPIDVVAGTKIAVIAESATGKLSIFESL